MMQFNDFSHQFTRILRTGRSQLGYTQTEMAERLRIGLRSYQRYESGVASPSLEILLAISQLLNMEPTEFFKMPAHCYP